MIVEYTKGEYTLSTDPNKLDLDVIHGYLTRSYWSEGIPMDKVAKGIENALCFGIYHKKEQVGFARVITDHARFAYLADVFVLEPHRGKGLSKWLMEKIMEHPELQGLSRFMLGTKDAHGLYQKFGFSALKNPEIMMEKVDNNVYKKNS
ncbi:GNAT family N-acetyltransferase [Fulvivirgaceae bacterium BMA12]|uniref:GNAT family N-acetyltransferase n=1 Tax=Agaribacillus aureus TaxID=3051825 RepID=A0ABT8LEN9_9BACT|nr:GNAT family N-acetyltransferase [Fulvivirgaceae bacterium BMA12]